MMDVQMPDMDGITATQHIKALPLMRIPPIIAMTAYSMSDDREKFLKSGMDDYVSKPIKADIFLLKIKEWIEKQQPNMKNFTSIVQAKNKKSNSIQQEEIVEEDAVVDHHILESLRKLGGDDLIQETYTELVAESQEQILKSLKALENKDYDTIKRELHTLKGNTGTLGVLKISKLAEAIEKRIKNGEFEHLLIHLENLLSLWKEYKNYFDTHIKHQP
jgi:response regulator RpfG family c-di-GMP phosphodiesterase